MIRLVAEDPTIRLDEPQATRVQFWVLEFWPATGCDVRRDPPVEITITGEADAGVHPPLLERVESIVGCRLQVQ